MAFWGVEVKPGKPYTHSNVRSQGRLRITQATIGNGNASKKCLLQCNVGKQSPVLLCSLIPDKVESCSLDLEFEEVDDVVFSVLGPRSIHLSGYHLSCGRRGEDDDDTDSYGEDIAETDTDESGSYDSEDEYEDDFIDDGDLEMFDSSPRANSGVVIEEIIEDEKPVNGADGTQRSKSKIHVLDDSTDSDRQIVVKKRLPLASESEDEDGFPISSLKHKSGSKIDDAGKNANTEGSVQEKIHRNIEVSEDAVLNMKEQTKTKGPNLPKINEDGKISKKEKLKRKKKKDKNEKGSAELTENVADKSKTDEDRCENEVDGKKADATIDKNPVNTNNEENHLSRKEHEFLPNINDSAVVAKSSKKKEKKKKKRTREEIPDQIEGSTIVEENDGSNVQNADNSETKKKKKSKKAAASGGDSSQMEPVNKNTPATEVKEQDTRPHQTREFPNGLIVEEIQMGKPDGKKAASGGKVSVYYVGKLKNGKIFDSNIGSRPFNFRLGVGSVIKGWDVGVNGMRVGDKRRLTIPPSMGYGGKSAGKIPPNSWLIFDVELVDVK